MTDATTATTPAELAKPRVRVMLWLFLGIVGMLLVWGFLLLGPNPEIVVSPATTRLTTPLADDGLPDYARVIREQMRKGVTPENNAAVPLWWAMWGESTGKEHSAIPPADEKLFCDEIGLPYPPPAEDWLEDPEGNEHALKLAMDWLRKKLPKREPSVAEENDEDEWPYSNDSSRWPDYHELSDEQALEDSRTDELTWIYYVRPWRADELPFMADWLERNQRAIDLLVEAGERPRWYSPSGDMIRGERLALLDSSIGSIQYIRQAARVLSGRALHRIAEGEYTAAWRDLKAVYHLGYLTSSGPTLVDQLVACAITGVANTNTRYLLDAPQLSAELAREILADLQQLAPPMDVIRAIDQGERFFTLEMLIGLCRETGTLDEWYYGDEVRLEILSRTRIDWNLVLEEFNKGQDRLVAAYALPNRVQRIAALEKFAAEVDAKADAASNGFAGGWFSVRDRSLAMSDLILADCFNSPVYVHAAEERLKSNLQLTRVAAALAVHRAEQGAYPKSLAALVPGILPQLPVDIFNAKPLVYQQTDDGFLLHSLGPNGKDDGGSCEEGTHGVAKLAGRDINGEYQRNPDTGEWQLWDQTQSVKDVAKIPAGADDYSLRLPLVVEPWPWEVDHLHAEPEQQLLEFDFDGAGNPIDRSSTDPPASEPPPTAPEAGEPASAGP